MIHLFADKIILFIEAELVHHEPEIQQFVLDEIAHFSAILGNYVASKLKEKIESAEHE